MTAALGAPRSRVAHGAAQLRRTVGYRREVLERRLLEGARTHA